MKEKAWLLAMLFGWNILVFAPVAKSSAPIKQVQTPIATVTGTPEGPTILVPDQVNVRTCPSVNCDLVGVLIAGQEAPAIGRSKGGEWIQIVYQGVPGNVAWVYAPFVVLEAGQSLLQMPTFTPAAPVIQPTFEPLGDENGSGFPPILAIIAFFVVGVFGMVISVLRGANSRL
jgi:hypothetical protein